MSFIKGFIPSFILSFLAFATIILYGGSFALSLIEEKENGLIENGDNEIVDGPGDGTSINTTQNTFSFALIITDEPATEEDDEESEEDAEEDTENPDAVTLSSVHASKGLEFPIVFVIAMEQNLFPHERALAEGSEDEELRLFYVAITRARKLLYLSRSKSRFHMGMNKPSSPSRFLDHLGDDVAERAESEELIETVSAADVRKAFEDFFKNLK